MTYLLGIDLGTLSLKTLLLDEEGSIRGIESKEYGIDTPQPNWSEQIPEVWWQAARESIRKLLFRSRIKPKSVLGIGLSGQMHGTVLIDKKKRCLRPAIIWADQRSKKECQKIYKKIGKERLIALTGNRAATGFMVCSLLWLKEKEKENFKRIEKVLLPKDYLRLRLTERVSTEVSDASGTCFFDIQKREWSLELLKLLGLPPGILPEVLESQEIAGEVSREAAEETGLAEGTPVIAGGADQPMGAIGNGIIGPGLVSSTIGTGGQLFTPITKVKVDAGQRIHTFCHALHKKWYLMGATLSAGLSLRWFRDKIEENRISYEMLSQEAERIRAGADGLIFLPYLIGERSPHFDSRAKGSFFGLTSSHTKGHFIRAIMEGVVYALRDSLEIFKEFIRVKGIIASGGGAKSNLWRQIQADIFNSELVVSDTAEQAALGAALLAGVGVGKFKDIEEACKKTIRFSQRTLPIPENVKRYDEYYRIYRSLYPTLKENFYRLDDVGDIS